MDVDALQSRAEIADLIHRYARNVRRREAADCDEIMTEDIVFVVREVDLALPAAEPTIRKKTEGKAEVLSSIIASTTSEVRVVPMVQNVLIEVDGDEARSNCVMISRTWPSGREFAGEYDDTFRRESGRWRFSARVFTMYL